MESCSRIKDGNGRLALEEDEVRRIWKDYFEDLYKMKLRVYMLIVSLAFVKVKGGESECFRIESGVRAEQVMSLLLFNVYMNVSEISRGGERLIALSLVCR